jgi:hypothetical protein
VTVGVGCRASGRAFKLGCAATCTTQQGQQGEWLVVGVNCCEENATTHHKCMTRGLVQNGLLSSNMCNHVCLWLVKVRCDRHHMPVVCWCDEMLGLVLLASRGAMRSCAHSALITAALCMFCRAKHTDELHHVAPHDEVSTWQRVERADSLNGSAALVAQITQVAQMRLPTIHAPSSGIQCQLHWACHK